MVDHYKYNMIQHVQCVHKFLHHSILKQEAHPPYFMDTCFSSFLMQGELNELPGCSAAHIQAKNDRFVQPFPSLTVPTNG